MELVYSIGVLLSPAKVKRAPRYCRPSFLSRPRCWGIFKTSLGYRIYSSAVENFHESEVGISNCREAHGRRSNMYGM